MTWVAGVDGCKDGWFAVFFEARKHKVECERFESLKEAINSKWSPRLVAVDIPIGLLEDAERGGRNCDREARTLLGQPRRSSVFNPPVHAALSCENYRDAVNANRKSSKLGIGLSKQTHALRSKIAEANDLLNPRLQSRIFEVHPELCFYEMAERKPMRYGKKAKGGKGIQERIHALKQTELKSEAKALVSSRE